MTFYTYSLRLVALFICTGISISQSFAQEQVIGAGNYSNVTITSSDNSSKKERTVNGSGMKPNLSAAARFLGQATLGANYEDIAAAADMGYEAWIDAQLAMPITFSVQAYVEELRARKRIAEGNSTAEANNQHWQFAWWQYVMSSPDVLRSRVALALSEIFVVSEIPRLIGEPLGLASYYDVLIKNALGNYRTLLYDVTLHPCMGVYLTHLNNPKSDVSKNQSPDENYAREIQQLFSIGLYELNLDGSRKLDAQGNPIPTYDNTDIAEFAKVFTGLTWSDRPNFGMRNPITEVGFAVPMRMDDSQHEVGPKVLHNGTTIPPRPAPTGLQDINDALDNLFQHPNVGPFISRLLIQRLVTSNPSPGYISRVATAFNNNGQGVRGDFKAVVKAILLDPEARDCNNIYDPHFGMLKEPLVRYVQTAKAFNARSESGEFRNTTTSFLAATGQRALASPSVFNFFQPNYQPLGPIEEAGLVAPEFQIVNSLTALSYANQVHDWTLDDILFDNGRIYTSESNASLNASRVYLKYPEERALLEAGKNDEFVERLNLILVQGNMSERTRQIVLKAIEPLSDDQLIVKLRLGIYLVLVSPDYLVQR